MQVTYELTADDYRHALLAHRNLNFFSRWGFLGGAFLLAPWAALQGYLIFKTDQSWLSWSLSLALVAICVLLFQHWGAPYFNARRQFRNTPSAQGPITLEVQDSGLHFRSASTDASVSWNHYIKWIEDECVFALLPGPLVFVVIPKRAFNADQLPQFEQTLREKVSVQKSHQG
jgi:hypothetical protein